MKVQFVLLVFSLTARLKIERCRNIFYSKDWLELAIYILYFDEKIVLKSWKVVYLIYFMITKLNKCETFYALIFI